MALAVGLGGLGLLVWLVVAVNGLHDRLSHISPWLAGGIVLVLILVASICGLVIARLIWRLGRDEPRPTKNDAPSDIIEAARLQADVARKTIARISEPEGRVELEKQLSDWEDDRKARRYHVVVFGTGSSGKSSLINALVGHQVAATEPTMGTTKAGAFHTHRIKGVEGELFVTDTPGLSEIGLSGARREEEARELAVRADLLLFVVDHDLTRSEYEPLVALIRQGKRSIVIFNKKDRYPETDRAAILARLRDRLHGLVPPEDIVAVAAAPRPIPVRVVQPDGTVVTQLEPEPIDLTALIPRLEAILRREGDSLRAGNLLLRAHLIGEAAEELVLAERDRKARGIIDRYQWITAGAVFANPIPAVDLLAAAAVQFQMISELGAAYEQPVSIAHARMIGSEMAQLLMKLGLVEAATSLVAGLFKSTLVGYATGGALQATTLAYLTHVSGHAFADYFRRGMNWGDGGMKAALQKQFELHRRADFLQEFGKQAIERLLRRGNASAQSVPDSKLPFRAP